MPQTSTQLLQLQQALEEFEFGMPHVGDGGLATDGIAAESAPQDTGTECPDAF
ncbi:YALI0B07733p [Yarrowia lipolytica CLIB122]|uniref:YALI0B07733p n=1 Tax=Yarrowia lipolytica (strain CLIB 122 / E 150) TaxID=284591 RepID=Q6CFE5_YARLI|nr:YALI0B07733p [Yarrowia lipolytica CLIB122]RMJ00955.1 hypothetical protein BD777DRAFT_139062 [Yarrowia lipolytica]CAG82850.2 YALI0B07733p [Yarrowia lipolytica CLIB122]|eukprot:XP_500617.2 YALI0B07733p [Yarrowia lipolytica CLIB122]